MTHAGTGHLGTQGQKTPNDLNYLTADLNIKGHTTQVEQSSDWTSCIKVEGMRVQGLRGALQVPVWLRIQSEWPRGRRQQ